MKRQTEKVIQRTSCQLLTTCRSPLPKEEFPFYSNDEGRFVINRSGQVHFSGCQAGVPSSKSKPRHALSASQRPTSKLSNQQRLECVHCLRLLFRLLSQTSGLLSNSRELESTATSAHMEFHSCLDELSLPLFPRCLLRPALHFWLLPSRGVSAPQLRVRLRLPSHPPLLCVTLRRAGVSLEPVRLQRPQPHLPRTGGLCRRLLGPR